MNAPLPPQEKEMIEAVRRRADRARASGHWGAVAHGLGQIGALGWQIVVPMLLGLAAGRWLDRHLLSGIQWTATLLFVGIVLGCWSAWRWMRRQ